MSYFLRAEKHDFSGPLALPRCSYTVDAYSWHAIGGPSRAVVEAAAPELDLWALAPLLRSPISIHHSAASKAWWGDVASIAIPTPTHTIQIRLDTVVTTLMAEYLTQGPRGTIA